MWDNAEAINRLTRWLLIITVLLLSASGIIWFYNSDYLPLKQVAVQGELTYSDGRELSALAHRHIRGNFLNVDLNGAKNAFEQYPWVASAKVMRKFPDTVEVKLVERVPVAKWSDTELLDSEGNIFKARLKKNSLPVFKGSEGSEGEMLRRYREFSEILAKQNLNIKELVHTPRSAWLLILDNGVTVRLGREHEVKRLRLFMDAWRYVLRKNENRLSYVDMRYKDGFSVRYASPGLSEDESDE